MWIFGKITGYKVTLKKLKKGTIDQPPKSTVLLRFIFEERTISIFIIQGPFAPLKRFQKNNLRFSKELQTLTFRAKGKTRKIHNKPRI